MSTQAPTPTSASAEVPAGLQAFADALDDFLRAARRARGRYNRQAPDPELSLSQYHLLEPLVAADAPLGVCELAEAAGVSPPSATRMLGGLEERGLVERVRGATDRRVVHVAVTPAGRALAEAKREVILTARARIFERLTPTERKSAARLLHRLAAAVEDITP